MAGTMPGEVGHHLCPCGGHWRRKSNPPGNGGRGSCQMLGSQLGWTVGGQDFRGSRIYLQTWNYLVGVRPPRGGGGHSRWVSRRTQDLEVAQIIRKNFLVTVVVTMVRNKPFGTRWTWIQILSLCLCVEVELYIGSISVVDYLALSIEATITYIPQPSNLLPGIYPTDNTQACGKQHVHKAIYCSIIFVMTVRLEITQMSISIGLSK